MGKQGQLPGGERGNLTSPPAQDLWIYGSSVILILHHPQEYLGGKFYQQFLVDIAPNQPVSRLWEMSQTPQSTLGVTAPRGRRWEEKIPGQLPALDSSSQKFHRSWEIPALHTSISSLGKSSLPSLLLLEQQRQIILEQRQNNSHFGLCRGQVGLGFVLCQKHRDPSGIIGNKIMLQAPGCSSPPSNLPGLKQKAEGIIFPRREWRSRS